MRKKILVIVDMQEDFVNGQLGTVEAKAIIEPIIDKYATYCGDKDSLVIMTRDTHYADYLQTQEGKFLPVTHCVEGTDGHEICHQLRAIQDMVSVIDKETFGSTGLINYFAEIGVQCGIESIEFVGVCTGICVIANALLAKTYFPEMPIIVDSACCACVTPESNKNALEVMKLLQIIVK